MICQFCKRDLKPSDCHDMRVMEKRRVHAECHKRRLAQPVTVRAGAVRFLPYAVRTMVRGER